MSPSWNLEIHEIGLSDVECLFHGELDFLRPIEYIHIYVQLQNLTSLN